MCVKVKIEYLFEVVVWWI